MVYQRHKNCQIGITICPGLRRTGQNFFSFTIGVVGGTFLEVIAQIYSKGENCSICCSVSFFVRGVIWHWAERYNCNIMSQILSFLTHLTSLPVGSISSSHSKISAICWCHFLVWVLIPIDGAAIDGDMLSIVLRTFLARILLNHMSVRWCLVVFCVETES